MMYASYRQREKGLMDFVKKMRNGKCLGVLQEIEINTRGYSTRYIAGCIGGEVNTLNHRKELGMINIFNYHFTSSSFAQTNVSQNSNRRFLSIDQAHRARNNEETHVSKLKSTKNIQSPSRFDYPHILPMRRNQIGNEMNRCFYTTISTASEDDDNTSLTDNKRQQRDREKGNVERQESEGSIWRKSRESSAMKMKLFEIKDELDKQAEIEQQQFIMDILKEIHQHGVGKGYLDLSFKFVFL